MLLTMIKRRLETQKKKLECDKVRHENELSFIVGLQNFIKEYEEL